MKTLIIIILLAFSAFTFEADTNGIPIVIIERKFDNLSCDTTRDTCICFYHDYKEWKILTKKNNGYSLPFNLFTIFKEYK